MQFPRSKKALLGLLSDGHFHSGAELARTLGVSRTAIWRLIHELEALGLELSAVTGKGYRLSQTLELLSEESIVSFLSEPAQALASRLEIHDELDSTNSHLTRQAGAGGAVCLAEFQSAGRGRVGRIWLSPFGGNICLSVSWHFDDHAVISGLSLAVGVAVVRALGQAGVAGIGLKWPNDILWCGRKLGGILLEVSGEAHGRHAVVIGIGLNLYISPGGGQAIDQAWTDLTQITGGVLPSRNRLIALVLNELLPMLSDYGQVGLRALLDEWRSYHCLDGEPVTLHQGERRIRGRVAGVNDAGLLLLDCEDGERRQFASGDVRLRADVL
jgi:BirA family biotin operon repressor/biotin-[acetyl-CoA-carboxylase] ligase